MSPADVRHPQAATCEDWDEDNEIALTDTHATANVAVKRSKPDLDFRTSSEVRNHDGSDSGYSSKAGTANSDASAGLKMADLKINTGIAERERQPYGFSSRPNPPRQSSSRPRDPPSPTKTYYIHEKGTCRICDRYGKHIDTNREMSRSSSAAPPPTSPKLARNTSRARAMKDEDSIPNPSRRMSSNRESRPLSINTATIQPVYSAGPAVYTGTLVAPQMWQQPITPTVPYSPIAFSYTPYAVAPTPYVTANAAPTYFDTTHDTRPGRLARRTSVYGEPAVIQHPAMKPDRTSEGASREIPTPHTHRSSRSIDQDRIAMPPPQRPPLAEVSSSTSRRPSIRKNATYDNVVSTRRLSQQYDDDEVPELRPTAYRERNPSPSRPPTSYPSRGPSQTDLLERPKLHRKSVTYSDAMGVKQVATSTKQMQPLHRSTTQPTTTLEQQEAEAEAYQRKRSSMTTNELTADALRKYTQRHASSKSETGSSYSQKSHHSSSKDSSGRERSHTSGAKTNITINGGISVTIPDRYEREGRPVTLDIGDTKIVFSGRSKDDDRKKEQQCIERAPSVVSRTSRRSTTSSVVSGKDVARPSTRDTSRRPSYGEERPLERMPGRRHSRAPSSTRASLDYGRRDDHQYYGA